MVSYDDWLIDQNHRAISDSRRAVLAWRRIQRDPVSITIKRGSATISAQTVRVVADANQASETITMPTSSAIRDVTIFGVTDHPSDSVPDTNLQRGDIFIVNGTRYRVTSKLSRPGEIHASAEVM